MLAVGAQLIDDTGLYQLICVNQTWLSVYASVYLVALLLRRRYPRLTTAVRVWVLKPILLLFTLQFYTLGIGINHYVITMDSLPTLVLISASIPAVGYVSALLRYFATCRCWRCFKKSDNAFVVVGPKMAPLSGADLAASNCLLAMAVFRLGLDQPEADMTSAVTIWLLIMHPLVLLCYWVEANVRRYMRKSGRHTVDVGQNHGSNQRQQLGLARKLLRVSLTAGGLKSDSSDDLQTQTIEKVTVV